MNIRERIITSNITHDNSQQSLNTIYPYKIRQKSLKEAFVSSHPIVFKPSQYPLYKAFTFATSTTAKNTQKVEGSLLSPLHSQRGWLSLPNNKNPYYICNSAFQFSLNFCIQLAYLESKKKAKDSFSKTKMLIISIRKQEGMVHPSPQSQKVAEARQKSELPCLIPCHSVINI